MKRCPFCAEEIQDAAVFCRYCSRRINVNYYRIFVLVLIITFIVIFAGIHRRQVRIRYYKTKAAISEFCVNFAEFFNSVRNIPQNMKAIKEYNEGIKSAINDITGKLNQDTGSIHGDPAR